MYERLGALNWFHLSNALPLCWRSVPMPIRDTLKFGVLGLRLTQYMGNADVISAESKASLALINPAYRDRLFLSVNGSDDELAHLQSGQVLAKERIATVVGTYRHKALDDSCRVFDMLRSNDDALKLLMFGDAEWIPQHVRTHPHVVVMGNRTRSEVIATLRTSKYYISTTRVENSYNAASEGIFFADESYISDIGPHRELLDGMPYDHVAVPGVARPMLHVVGQRISGANLKSWDEVVGEMIARIKSGSPATPQGLR
jgi:glycosyltransferase involved in cell wall biosynthesis